MLNCQNPERLLWTSYILSPLSTQRDFEDSFQTDRLLSDVKDEVLTKLKLDQSKADEYIVTFDRNPLDESKKLSEFKLTDGAVLVIERREVTKI